LIVIKETVARREAPDLVEAHRMCRHKGSSANPRRDGPEVAKDVLRRWTGPTSPRHPTSLSLDDGVVEIEKGEGRELILTGCDQHHLE
jgi:hypothetical protein